jgi:methylated-DNA-[protein]-cysteine S-methyltransferase
MTLTTTTVETPVGELRLVASSAGLRAVLWPDRQAKADVVAPSHEASASSPLLDDAARQLGEYFAGARTTFDLPLELLGTSFQRTAWLALAEIPFGETRSYAEQARRIGRPRAVRAVGAANGRNPLPIVLPCHRVVGSDGSLTGFGGGLEVKRALLDHEAGLRPLF